MAADTSGSSVSAFVTNLIVNGIIFLIFVGLFVYLRNREKRVYLPRAGVVSTVPLTQQVEQPPSGAFGWLNYLLKKPESWIIQQAGPDGYFFLRYIFLVATILFTGGVIILPILLPVNATNGHNAQNSGFDLINFGNVANKNRYFAHVFLSWFFFGLIIFVIYRELVYYVNFRHSFQTTPYIDSLVSTKTLLISSLPKPLYDDEAKIKALFPAATDITFARDYKQLIKDVKERTKLAGKYEGALNGVINKSLKIRAKAIKKNKEVPTPADQVDSYLKEKKQPHHKLKFLIGKKVNTIDYANEKLPELNKTIKDEQVDYIHANAIGSVFLHFPSQLELQKAKQAIKYNKEFKKAGSQTVSNAAPDEIIWENLGLSLYTRLGKKTIAATVLTVTIIFWAIPVAAVGAISNINFLIEKVHFLRFINNLPHVLLGLITGLLPTVCLAILMSLVPPFIKALGKVSGLVTLQQIDLWCQDWYYAFQVVQVFLVTTLASSAVSVVPAIINDPSSALVLLAQKLPKASNFYISYILFQGLAIPGGALFQVVTLILSKILGRFLDNTPRKKWTRFNSLSQPSWGVIYPVYSLIAVITIIYAIIAPIIIGFGFVAFTLIYIGYLYNLTYVCGQSLDSRGRNYPKALFQLFVPLYLAEICLIGLFVMAKSWGPFALEIVALVATVATHIWLKWKFVPLYDVIPLSGFHQAAGIEGAEYPTTDLGRKEVQTTGKTYWDTQSIIGKEDDISSEGKTFSEKVLPTVGGVEDPIDRKPSVDAVKRFFAPKKYLAFGEVRKLLPSFLNQEQLYTDEQLAGYRYVNPAVKDPEPAFWIPHDELGLSTTLISKAQGLQVSDGNTTYDEKKGFDYTGPPPDYEEAVKA